MFSFFKGKSSYKLDCSFLKVDMHAHLLPGIDDGARTLSDSVQMIRALKESGYQKLIATPHIMSEYYPNTPENIKSKLWLVREALKKEKIDILIEAAAEYYLDEHFEKMIQQDQELLTFGDQNILVEFSMLSAPVNGLNVLFQLISKGYRPILAHPERYLYWMNEVEMLEKIKAMGVLLQVNLLSLGGYYGPLQRKLGRQLLKSQLVDYLGTDLHRMQQMEYVHSIAKNRSLNKLIESSSFANQTL